LNFRKILLVTNLALVLIIGCAVVKTVLMEDKPEDASDLDTEVAANNTPSEPALTQPSSERNYDAIAQRKLFASDEPSATVPATAKPAKPACPRSSVFLERDYVLRATFAGPSRIARAIIEDVSAKTADSYKIDDVIYEVGDGSPAVRLESVKKNAVVLTCNGQRRILRLRGNKTPSVSGGKNSRKASSSKLVAVIKKSRSGIQLRNEIIENFLNTARIEPYVVDGKIQGLRLNELDKMKNNHFPGLRNGDVIQIINGQKLTSKQKAFQVFKKAMTQPNLNIEFLRDKKHKTLSFPMR
jgi:type II secretion system protein C